MDDKVKEKKFKDNEKNKTFYDKRDYSYLNKEQIEEVIDREKKALDNIPWISPFERKKNIEYLENKVKQREDFDKYQQIHKDKNSSDESDPERIIQKKNAKIDNLVGELDKERKNMATP